MTTADTATPHEERMPLRRVREGSILGGVASGLAEYLDVDTAVVRIGFVALCLLAGIALPVYIAGWLLIPEAGSDSAIADDLLAHTRPN